MMNGQTARGVLMALGTALAWGGTGSFAKLIAAGGVSQLTVVCYRGFFAASVVGLFMLARRGSSFFRCTRAELAQYAALGVFTVLFNATGYMMSCVYLSVPQVLMLNYTFPIVTMAGSALINGERPAPLQVLSGFLVLAGLYVGFAAGGVDLRSISASRRAAWTCARFRSRASRGRCSPSRASPATRCSRAESPGNPSR